MKNCKPFWNVTAPLERKIYEGDIKKFTDI